MFACPAGGSPRMARASTLWVVQSPLRQLVPFRNAWRKGYCGGADRGAGLEQYAAMFREEPWLGPAVGIATLGVTAALAVRGITNYSGYPNASITLSVSLLVVCCSPIVRLSIAIGRMWRDGIVDPLDRLRAAAPAAWQEQASIIAAVLLVGILLAAASYLKSLITAVVPFWADAPLARLDEAVGIDSRTVSAALGPALPSIGLFYGLWHAVNLGGILWVVHWADRQRGRFILSYMLTWGVGMLVAYSCSSAGPLFTGRYDLSQAPESVRVPAQFLWDNYKANGVSLGAGISAFPSLHVAIAAWFATVLAYRGWSKIGIAYVAAIWICSVVLGWHYAADGAGGIAVAWLADRMARRLMRSKAQVPLPAPALRSAAR